MPAKTEKIADIDKGARESEYKYIHDLIEKCELGVRAISVIYDEHSSDQNSKANIFRIKDNLYYRLSSIRHHFKLLLNEIIQAEAYCEDLTKEDPHKLSGFGGGNPYFDRIERDISSVFDGLIYNCTTIFDYFSHMICYIIHKNKQETHIWTKLALMSRSSKSEIWKTSMKDIVDQLDRSFIAKLYDYRSRLIHNKRDMHRFSAINDLMENKWTIELLVSEDFKSKKYLNKIVIQNPHFTDYTILFAAKWLIQEMEKALEVMITGLNYHIKSNSHFGTNLTTPKKGSLLRLGSFDKSTNTFMPIGDILYNEYKSRKVYPDPS